MFPAISIRKNISDHDASDGSLRIIAISTHGFEMARMARVVVPGYPHHVTQRGNRQQPTFFCCADYRAYMRLVAKARPKVGLSIWAYCLMPNHVHLVVVPREADSLARLFGEAHRKYTRRINKRENWCGHLWQERFHSCPMDEEHLLAAVRYIELNPVRAGLCDSPTDWNWSSVHAHRRGEDDLLVEVRPMLQRIGDWDSFLSCKESPAQIGSLRKNSSTGRPIGVAGFITELERLTGRTLFTQRARKKETAK